MIARILNALRTAPQAEAEPGFRLDPQESAKARADRLLYLWEKGTLTPEESAEFLDLVMAQAG